MTSRTVSDRLRAVPDWLRVVIICTALAAVFGAYLRFAEQNDVFCQAPDEMSEVMPGTRLHALPLLNISAPTRYNFIRSMFYSQHGLGDVSFYYLASGTLSLLHLPVSERSLFFAGGVTNLAFALAGGLLAASVIGSIGAGWIFALLVLVSPFYVFVSKTGWARLSWTPLLLVLVFLCQWMAMRRRSAGWTIALCALAGFAALTDAFVMLPVVGVLAWLLAGGRRGAPLLRDPVFLAAAAVIAAAVAVDVLIGLIAQSRGTGLTMISYVLVRGQSGVVPSLHVLTAWMQCVDYYFPFRGAWIVVAVAFVLATLEGFRGRLVGFVAAWWALASIGILRYAAAMEDINPTSVPGFLNAYYIAPPSFLLVAWLVASVGERRLKIAGRVRPQWGGIVACVATLTLAFPMARQAYLVTFAMSPRLDIGPNRLVKYTDMPLSTCRTVKAAAFYIRSHEKALPFVFHLSSDPYLGHIGEFYYGLSYSRSSRPEDPNHLLDFGWHQFSRHYSPEAFYSAYGVSHFDYYVDFIEERGNLSADRAFAVEAADRLKKEGARVVCTIWDQGRPIGRILSFQDEPPTDLEYRAAAAGWDRRFGRASTLLQEPLAGSSYHFGYNWRSPSEPSR